MTNLPKFKFALREDLINNIEFLPTRGEPKATGWDVRCAPQDRQPIVFRPFEKKLIPLGFRAFCPEGWWYELKPRSSTFAKKNLNCLYGTIDETFNKELMFCCQFIPNAKLSGSMDEILQINFGEAIGQIIPVKRQEMEVEHISDEELERLYVERNAVRDGGFGSTNS